MEEPKASTLIKSKGYLCVVALEFQRKGIKANIRMRKKQKHERQLLAL